MGFIFIMFSVLRASLCYAGGLCLGFRAAPDPLTLAALADARAPLHPAPYPPTPPLMALCATLDPSSSSSTAVLQSYPDHPAAPATFHLNPVLKPPKPSRPPPHTRTYVAAAEACC